MSCRFWSLMKSYLIFSQLKQLIRRNFLIGSSNLIYIKTLISLILEFFKLVLHYGWMIWCLCTSLLWCIDTLWRFCLLCNASCVCIWWGLLVIVCLIIKFILSHAWHLYFRFLSLIEGSLRIYKVCSISCIILTTITVEACAVCIPFFVLNFELAISISF